MAGWLQIASGKKINVNFNNCVSKIFTIIFSKELISLVKEFLQPLYSLYSLPAAQLKKTIATQGGRGNYRNSITASL